MVKRYDPHWRWEEMAEDGEGAYVEYTDYAALTERVKELEEKIESLNDYIYEIQERM